MQRYVLPILTATALIGATVYMPTALPWLFGTVAVCLLVWIAKDQIDTLLAGMIVPFESLKTVAASMDEQGARIHRAVVQYCANEGCQDFPQVLFRCLGGVLHFAALCIFLLVDYYLFYEVARGWAASDTVGLPLPFADSPETVLVIATVVSGAFWGTVWTDTKLETNFSRWHTLTDDRRQQYANFAKIVFTVLISVYLLIGLFRGFTAIYPPAEVSESETAIVMNDVESLRSMTVQLDNVPTTSARYADNVAERFGHFVQLTVHPAISIVSLGSSIVAASSVFTVLFLLTLLSGTLVQGVIWLFARALNLTSFALHLVGTTVMRVVAIVAFLGAALVGQNLLENTDGDADEETEQAPQVADYVSMSNQSEVRLEQPSEESEESIPADDPPPEASTNSKNWNVFNG